MNSMLGLAVGVCGLAFIGYCVYFDNKRRNDPNFKEKLRARRKAAEEEEAAALRRSIPPLKDNEAVQKFFLQEVHLGEELLSRGDAVRGVEHLANAVVVCSQPKQLLNILNTTLPPSVFQLLLQQLTTLKGQQPHEFGPHMLGMAEEDIDISGPTMLVKVGLEEVEVRERKVKESCIWVGRTVKDVLGVGRIEVTQKKGKVEIY